MEDLRHRLERIVWKTIHNINDKEVNQQWNLFIRLFQNAFEYSCPIKKIYLKSKIKTYLDSEEIEESKKRPHILDLCRTRNFIFIEPYKR